MQHIEPSSIALEDGYNSAITGSMLSTEFNNGLAKIASLVHAAIILALSVMLPNSTLAQPEQLADTSDPAGSRLAVYLVTVGPGRQVWERFGHNAIWIRDNSSGTDRAYNYGLFSFAQEGFVERFLKGRMEYWMRGFPAEPHLQEYASHDRSVWIQELNLSEQQKAELRDFLVWNERPENRFYSYHYYYDNCSTRIRDALDRVLDGTIRDQTENDYPDTTLRYHSLRLVSDDLWVYLGLLLGLGQPVDRPISAWEEMFLPLKLREHLRGVVVRDARGTPKPLVLAERTIHESSQFTENEAPPHWTPRFLGAGLVLALFMLFAAQKATEGRLGRRVFATVGVAWSALTGLAGLGLAGLWLLTDHDTSYRNENLFWFTPAAILLALVIPMLILRISWASRLCRWVALLVAGLSLLGFALQILPGMDQVNGPLIAFVMPPNLAMAAGLLWYSSIES